MSSFTDTDKSTTVRAKYRSGSVRIAQSALLGLDALAPTLAARVATHWMFRTRRRVMEAWEREALESGERLSLEGPSGALAAYRWGQGPLVLLVHGWNGRATQLGAFVPPLVAAGFQVVAFDAPGHGASQGSRSSIVEFANAFDCVLDAVRPFFRPLHGVITHSMGGAAVTLALARASGHWQSRDRQQSDGPVQTPRLVFFAPPIDLRDLTAGFSSALGLGGATLAAMESLVEKQLGTNLYEMHALRLAAQMQSSLLVLHDDADRAVPVENGRRLVAAWPGAELCVTRGLGHSRILRDAAAVRRAVHFIRG
jgi:pimeloyl-ACP methyl ester carboxylesterase